MKPIHRTPLWAALLLLVTVAVYWPGLSGGFIFDDISTIVDNERVHATTLDAESLIRAARSFEPGGTLGSRPIAMSSFAVDYVFGELDPWGYKLVGLLVHLANTLLIFMLVRRLLSLPSVGGEAWAVAASGAVALLWAIHPLQVSTVLYVVQRMETLSLTFVLLALLAYLRGRNLQQQGRRAWPWLLACLPLVGLGMAAKESAILFPGYALGLELTVLGFAATSARTARAWRWSYALAVAAAAATFLLLIVPQYWSDGYLTRNFGTTERLLTQLRVLPMYLGQILLPLPGSMPFYYDHLAPSRGLLEPATTLLGGLLLTALLLSALALRRRVPLFALGVLWFFAAHALTSNVVALELVFEHRNYFALLGVLLALTDLVRRIPMRDSPTLKYIAVAAVIAGFGVLAVIRASIWGDPFLLATDLASKNPESGRASADLAAAYLEMTDGHQNSPFNDFAMREFERGSLLPGASIVSDQGLILTAAQAGRPIKDEWWLRLIDKVKHGTLSPETTGALFGLLQNRYKDVPLNDDHLIDAFLALFSRASLPPYSYTQFGDYVLVKVGDEQLADQVFALAMERSQAHPDYARKIVQVLRSEGHLRQARVALDRAHELGMLMEISRDDLDVDDQAN
ncbi:glycosyltransferase family 39 protein [Luteimonas suaedae]|uniref:glycosyltransferase family 39 protein n=1 Tax=Luteimonas suaedae TaxID=2605430 RepID=UPI0011EBA109|nr:glycosyltransferase family 39 protein [Luteimonas suaedae]